MSQQSFLVAEHFAGGGEGGTCGEEQHGDAGEDAHVSARVGQLAVGLGRVLGRARLLVAVVLVLVVGAGVVLVVAGVGTIVGTVVVFVAVVVATVVVRGLLLDDFSLGP